MAIYLDNSCVSDNFTPNYGDVVQKVAVLPVVGDSTIMYYLTQQDGVNAPGFYYWTGTSYQVLSASVAPTGTTNYNELNNKPRVNGVVLQGNTTLSAIDAAAASNTYTKSEVDSIISSAQKVYVTSYVPTPVSSVGLYYVDQSASGGTGYHLYLVDSNKVITDLGGGEVSLNGYQKILDTNLTTTNKTVPGAINELLDIIKNLDITGSALTISGDKGIEAQAIYNDAGTAIVGYKIQHSNSTTASTAMDTTAVALKFGDQIADTKYTYDAQGHVTSNGVKNFKLPSIKLNGSSEQKTSLTFYAPTTAGTAGQLLVSNGEGAPVWKDPEEGSDAGAPIGSIIPFCGSSAPDGWLLCDGSLFLSVDANGNPTKYKPLYDIIGTTYGKSDDFGSFKVPDLRSRFIEGASTTTGHTLGSYVDAGLPDHKHTFTGSSSGTGDGGSHSHSWSQKTTNKSGTDTMTVISYSEDRGRTTMSTGSGGSHSHSATASGTIGKASADNSVYGKSTTVQPAAVCLNYIIKY